jgi:hypothetical protein
LTPDDEHGDMKLFHGMGLVDVTLQAPGNRMLVTPRRGDRDMKSSPLPHSHVTRGICSEHVAEV